MPKLIYNGPEAQKTVYRGSPHIVFKGTADDLRPHAEVAQKHGDLLILTSEGLYSWDTSKPIAVLSDKNKKAQA